MRMGTAIVVAAFVGVVVTIATPHGAEAMELKNFVTDLFGGQGIQINDIGEGTEQVNFNNSTIQSFGNFNSGIAGSLGASSLSSAVSGSLFDITQGMPVESTESLGPLVGERAETLGQGHFNFGISYSHTTFKRLNNASLGSLTAALAPTNCGTTPIGSLGCDDEVLINIAVKLERDVTTLAAAYGITRNWDVGVLVPIVHIRATASANATLNDLANDGDTFTQTGTRFITSPNTGGDATGIGDVIFRTKYNLVRDPGDFADLALYSEVKAPTGDQNNLLGSGNTDALGEIVVSKQLGAVAPHLNVGYQYAMGKGSDRSNLRYVVGADERVTNSVTIGADIVGQYNDVGLNLVDATFGIKWNVFGRALLTAGILAPINGSEGLRPDFSYTLRFEMGF
jgi:hypothetical protein